MVYKTWPISVSAERRATTCGKLTTVIISVEIRFITHRAYEVKKCYVA
jgi:hypothetical protein